MALSVPASPEASACLDSMEGVLVLRFPLSRNGVESILPMEMRSATDGIGIYEGQGEIGIMDTYMKKSPIHYTILIQGFKNEFGWYLSNEDEIDEFARKFNMDWHWNMRKGILDFEDRNEGIKLNRPWNVRIGQVVVAYDDWGTWRVDLWDLDEFEKRFIKMGD